MHLLPLLAFLAPLAAAATTYDLTGICKNGICEIETAFASPVQICNGRAGQFSGSGTNGRSSCTGTGRCTYIWTC
ncbi:hypothetical protein ACN47E_001737 [Coniothyrium glycines]